MSEAASTGLPTGLSTALSPGRSTESSTGEPLEADLLARLDARGIALRPEEVAPVLATARFLARAARLVREAQP